ncbi:phosphodiester glycosidase family protein [Anaerolineales bacterium HSG24]|nr:phosphodiester glycosidase family protein [Anaerolineales bacterium HSG24]
MEQNYVKTFKSLLIIGLFSLLMVLQVDNTLAQSPPNGCAWVYKQIEYQGTYQQFCNDVPFVGWDWNDAVMSIQLPVGYEALIYSDADYGGNSVLIYHDRSWSRDLRNANTAPVGCAGTWDMCLSSLRVCTVESCPSANPATQAQTYEATYYNKKAYSNGIITMEAGSTETVWVEFSNSGTLTWPSGITRLGTVDPNNHDGIDFNSPFAHSSWVDGNSLVRPAWLNDPVVPGAIGKFEFIIQAPTTPGSHKFIFKPIVEGQAWMSVVGYWNIDVVSTQQQPSNTKPTIPNILPPEHIKDSTKNVYRLSWNSATDQQTPSHQLQYQVRVGEQAESSDIINVGYATFYEWPHPGIAGNYYWQVRACDIEGLCGEWNEQPGHIAVAEGETPNNNNNTPPYNLELSVDRQVVVGRSIRFEFSAQDDGQIRGLDYSLQVATDPDFSPSSFVTGIGFRGNINEIDGSNYENTEWNDWIPSNKGHYWVRVGAYDGQLWSEWTDGKYFFVNASAGQLSIKGKVYYRDGRNDITHLDGVRNNKVQLFGCVANGHRTMWPNGECVYLDTKTDVINGEYIFKVEENDYSRYTDLPRGYYTVRVTPKENYEIDNYFEQMVDLTQGSVEGVNFVATRPKQESHWEKCDEITKGICVRDGEFTHIAVADLDHPNVNVMLAQEFVDGSDKMRRGTIFARTNQSAHNNYHAAINASGFKCIDGGKNGFVEEDDKGLNTLVVDNRTIARTYKASFISYEDSRLSQASIYRNGLDFATQYESVDNDHEKNDVRQEVGRLTNGVDFAVGYRATIFDRDNYHNDDGMLSDDAYKNIESDDDYWTAIGVSENGSRLYLMSAHETMSLKMFASEFQQVEGVHQAILLDGGGSSQFVSMGKTPGTTLYNNVIEPLRGKSDWKTIRHDCNDEKRKPRRIVNAIIVAGGEVTPNQQKLLNKCGTHFIRTDRLVANFESNTFFDGIACRNRQSFDSLTLSYQQHPITDTGTLRSIGYFYTLEVEQDDGTLVTPQKPYSMTVFYGEENFDHNLFEEDLALYYKQGDEWVKEPTSIIDVEANTVNVQTTAMGLWAILAEVRPATLTLTSVTNQPANIAFSVDGAEPFILTSNAVYSMPNLYPGDYLISQDPTSMPDQYWTLINVSCEDQHGQSVSATIDRDNFQADISVAAGQHLTCTFLNERAGYGDGRYRIYLPEIIKGIIE